MDYPDFIVCSFMENPNGQKRVNMLHSKIKIAASFCA